MRTLALRALLGSIVAAAAASGACTLLPQSQKEDCPHTVVDRSTSKGVEPTAACDLMASLMTGGTTATTAQSCSKVCGDTAINYCQLPNDYTTAFFNANPNLYAADAGPPACPTAAGPTVTLTCQQMHNEGSYHSGCPMDGRRPAGLRPAPAIAAPAVGAFFAACAHLEAASVFAFRMLAEELRAHGAPGGLIDRAERAAHEEVRHARVTRGLAARFGGVAAPAGVAARTVRPLFEIALENAVEGLVRETFGAALALFRAEHAADGAVRDAMRSIAEDECGHAAFSADLDAWARAHLDAADCARLDAAVCAAIVEVAETFRGEPHPDVRRIAGAPSASQSRRMLALLERDVWRPARAANG